MLGDAHAQNEALASRRTRGRLGNTNSTIFDAASRRVAAMNPLGFVSSNVFDAANRLVATCGSA